MPHMLPCSCAVQLCRYERPSPIEVEVGYIPAICAAIPSVCRAMFASLRRLRVGNAVIVARRCTDCLLEITAWWL